MGKSLVTGIDIGYHSIKVVVLKPYKGTCTLVGYQELPTEADIFSDNHMLNYQKIVKKLKELRKSLPIFSRKVALVVPDNAVISKVLQIDSGLKEHEREFTLLEAFSSQSLFPAEELCIDYVEIDRDEGGNTAHFQVFATKKEVIDNRVQALLGAGFSPFLIDLQAHCLLRIWQLVACQLNRSDWLLVTINLQSTTVCLDFSQHPPYCKELAVGVSPLIKPEEGSHFDNQSQAILDELMTKLQRTIQFVNSMHQIDIQGVWLCGEGAQNTSMVNWFEQHLGLEVQLIDPFDLLVNSAEADPKRVSGSSYVTAIGIALRGVAWLESQGVA